MKDIARIVLAAAIAATMGLALWSVAPVQLHASLGHSAVAIQVAEKGSDGQETHG